jgi:hypothetical protein
MFGVKDYDFEVLFQLGLTINQNELIAPEDEVFFSEIWETWEWLIFYQVNHGSLSKEDFVRLYSILKRIPCDFKHEYQKANEQDGIRLAKLHSSVQAVLRPHLSVAFLPASYGSDVWPLLGRPLKRVKVSKGFGDSIPEELLNAVEENYKQVSDDSILVYFAYILSNCFVEILKISNDFDRPTRLGLRQSAFEILPFFINFELNKVKK